MRLSLLAYCLGSMAGVLLPTLQGVLLTVVACGLIAGTFLFILSVPRIRCLMQLSPRWAQGLAGGVRLRPVLTRVLAALLGLGWHVIWAEARLQQQLPEALEGRDLLVQGVVADLPVQNGAATQFQLQVTDSAEGLRGRRLLLNDYAHAALATGQEWQLRVRLNRPHGYANPGGFDYEAWLLQQHVVAKGYVRDDPNNRLLGFGAIGWQSWRASVQSRLREASANLRNRGAILALGVGDRSGLGQRDWALLTASGTNHLFVISGLHIGLVWSALYALLSGVLRLSPGIARFWPRQKWAAAGALLGAALYSLLAGFTLPTQRAFVMLAAFVFTQLGNRPMPVSVRFWLALALVLTLDPLAPVFAGFWLSFGAVATLLLGMAGRDRAMSDERNSVIAVAVRWLRPQAIVFVALLPVLVLFTGQFTWLAPIVNVLAIPLVGLVILPLLLLAIGLLILAPPLAVLCLALVDRVLELLFAALRWFVSFGTDWSLQQLPTPALPVLVTTTLAVALALSPLSWRRRWLAVPLALPLFLSEGPSIALDELRVHILDVGQGLAVILQSRDHALVYDTGARLSPEFSLGTAVVVPVLRQLGVRRLDVVVVSHFDNDHVGGLTDLLAVMPVSVLYSNDPARAQLQVATAGLSVSEVQLSRCETGVAWRWGAAEFRFLHPEAADATPSTGNDGSCVLQVRLGQHAVLLPGDIEARTERELIRRNREQLGSTLLVAPHHGSNSSSTWAFVKAVTPRIVVYAAGYRNSFGHPTRRTRGRYLTLGATDFVTSTTGMLTVTLRAEHDAPILTSYRQAHRRYWN